MPDTPVRLAAALADRYRLERELGQGGMATVYLAEDLKHKRFVALKVLKPELAAVLGADRFVQEITTTASLQHPNILPLFDSGTADGFLFYVMPFIDGETLRSRLNRETQLGVDEAVRIATEVAEALHHAHQHGVIHRDIKPENILLTDGRPMVADFGIALAVSAAAGGRMTETGLSLGTPHYMSPEQATAAKEITARSDIYSLAAVLYELLTGVPPHTGVTAQQIIMKIVTEEVGSVTKLRRSVPPNVAAAVATALEKLPADRFTSAREFADALGNPGYRTTAAAVSPAGGAATLRRSPVALAGWVLWGLTAIVAGWLWTRGPAGGPEPVRRYVLQLAGAEAVAPIGSVSQLVISPDGSRFAYLGGAMDNARSWQLWVRDRSQLNGSPIPGTERAQDPSWSPDGRRIAFVTAPGVLKVASLDGSPPIVISDSLRNTIGGGTAWGPDGTLYSAGGFGMVGSTGILGLLPNGGGRRAFTTLDTARHEFAHVSPTVLPNNRGLVFAIWYGPTRPNDTEIAVLDLKTGTYRVLQAGIRARYLSTGDLLVARVDGSLIAVPFDQNRLEATGPGVPVVTGVQTRAGYIANYDVSTAGTLVYLAGVPGNVRETLRPVWVTREGVATPVDTGWTFERPFNGGMTLSPDGTRLALAIAGEPNSDIWIKQLDHGPLSRLTFGDHLKYRPTWSPDGQSITYLLDPGNNNGSLYRKRADGGGEPEHLLSSPGAAMAEGLWSADGQWLVVRHTIPSRDLLAFRPGTDTALIPIVANPQFDERAVTLSPDGRWIAYQSDETGRSEIYVRPFPAAQEGRWQVSASGGSEPLWSRGGNEIFFRASTGDMTTVPVTTNPSFSAGTPRALFPAGGYALGPSYRAYDVTPDGRRFLMFRPLSDSAASPPTQLVVVDHWFQELKARRRQN